MPAPITPSGPPSSTPPPPERPAIRTRSSPPTTAALRSLRASSGPSTAPGYGTISPTACRTPASGSGEVFSTLYDTAVHRGDVPHLEGVSGLARDNRGGLWLVAGPYFAHAPSFYHYTVRINAPVSSDVPQ